MQICMSYCYMDCEIWVELVSLDLIWKVLIWYMPIAPNAKYAGLQYDGNDTFRNVCQYICQLVQKS